MIPVIISSAILAGSIRGRLKSKKAKKISEDAIEKYNERIEEVTEHEAGVKITWSTLESTREKAWKSFGLFMDAFEKIKNRPTLTGRLDKVLSLPDFSIQAIEPAKYSTLNKIFDFITFTTLGRGLLGGILANHKGNKNLQKAYETEEAVEEAIDELNKVDRFYDRLKLACEKLDTELRTLQAVYNKEVKELSNIVAHKINYLKFDDHEKTVLDNNIMLVKIMKKEIDIKMVDSNRVHTGTVDKTIKESTELRDAIGVEAKPQQKSNKISSEEKKKLILNKDILRTGTNGINATAWKLINQAYGRSFPKGSVVCNTSFSEDDANEEIWLFTATSVHVFKDETEDTDEFSYLRSFGYEDIMSVQMDEYNDQTISIKLKKSNKNSNGLMDMLVGDRNAYFYVEDEDDVKKWVSYFKTLQKAFKKS